MRLQNGLHLRHFNVLVAATTCALALPLHATDLASRPISVSAEARVEIDPAGKLVRVESADNLQPAMRTYVEQEVAKWQFRRNDANPTGNATTWLYLSACGVPSGRGYTMGLSYHGNGPRVAGSGWKPSGELVGAVARSRWNGAIQVHYIVNPDGKATLESIDGLPGGRAGAALEPAIARWIEGPRYDPETLGGKPVATRATLPLEFASGRGASKEKQRALAIESPACKQAGMAAAGMQAVAVDSNIGVVPSI